MATSINTFNVNLVMNASEYIKKSDLSRGATAKLRKSIEDARTPTERWERQIRLLEAAFEQGAIPDIKVFNRLVQQANRELWATKHATGGVIQNVIKMARDLHIAILFARQLVRVFSKPITMFAELEQSTAAMEVLLGSAEKAQFMVSELRQFAAETPLTFKGAINASRTLLQFGVSAEKVIPQVKMLGEIVGGNEERFKALVLAYSQMQAANRLLGQDLRQMVDAGFNPLLAMSEQLGVSFDTLLAKQRDGLISAEMVLDATAAMVEAGGKYHGLLKKIEETTSGALEKTKSQIDIMTQDLGRSLAPITMTVLENFLSMGPAIQEAMGLIDKLTHKTDELNQTTGVYTTLMRFVEMQKDPSTAAMGTTNLALDGAALAYEKIQLHAENLFGAMTDNKVAAIGFKEETDKTLEFYIRARKMFGSGLFSDETNEKLDEYTEKRRKLMFLEESAETKRKRAQEKIQNDRAREAETAEKAKESFDKALEKLKKELNLRRAGVVEGTYMNELLNGRTKIQARQLANVEKLIEAEKDRVKAEKDAATELEKKEKEKQSKIEAFEKRVISLRQQAYKQAMKTIEDEKKARKKFFDDVKALGNPAADKGSGDDVEALLKMRQDSIINRNAKSKEPDDKPTQRELVQATLDQLTELRDANIQRGQVLTAINNMAEKIGGIKIGKTR